MSKRITTPHSRDAKIYGPDGQYDMQPSLQSKDYVHFTRVFNLRLQWRTWDFITEGFSKAQMAMS